MKTTDITPEMTIALYKKHCIQPEVGNVDPRPTKCGCALSVLGLEHGVDFDAKTLEAMFRPALDDAHLCYRFGQGFDEGFEGARIATIDPPYAAGHAVGRAVYDAWKAGEFAEVP